MNKKLLQSLRNSEELLTQWNALTPALTHLFWLITNNDYATPQGGTKFQVIEDFNDFYRNRKIRSLIINMTQQKEDLKKLAQAYFTVDNNLSTVSLLEATTIHAQIGEMIKKLDSAIELNHSMISEIKAKKAKIKNSANTIEAYADTLLQAYESSNDRIKESARHGKTWDELSERLHSISNIFSLKQINFQVINYHYCFSRMMPFF